MTSEDICRGTVDSGVGMNDVRDVIREMSRDNSKDKSKDNNNVKKGQLKKQTFFLKKY